MLEAHLEKLQSFYIAAHEKSFLRASLVLRLTQPAITKSIKILEDHLGTSLFVRHRRGVELTQAGQRLYRFCDQLFAKMKDVETQITSSTAELSGVIKIGTYETLGELFWPKVLRRLQKDYPHLVVELITQTSNAAWQRLENGALDFIVDAEPPQTDAFFSKVLYSDRFALFCKTGSRFQDFEKNIPVALVTKAYDKKRLTIEQHLQNLNLPLAYLYQVESFTMVRALILEDVCIGVLPLRMAAPYLGRQSIQPFLAKRDLTFGEHRICVTCLEATKKEPRTAALIDVLKSLS